MLQNEEDLRVNLIVPYLHELGFNNSEISLETSFSIRIGKTQKIIKGYSDILCKRHGRNLFIIELKKDTHKIEQKDIDQGISYARALIDNIAPFTIVTNGKDTKIFDTITRQELTGTKISQQSDFWKNGCTLSTEQELNIRYEALKNFVSFSNENMLFFCKDQIESRIKPISGDLVSSNAKYDKDRHIQRQALHLIFEDFIISQSSAFGLVGDAGVGKTCSMCSLAYKTITKNFAFFYNASILGDTILGTIASDLNLFFSSGSEANNILKKLDELARFTDRKVIIFIDGIDESTNVKLQNELSELAYKVGKLDNIKICVSCKSFIWENFLKSKDTNNHLHEELSNFHKTSSTIKAPSYTLEVFNDDEVASIVAIYQEAFNLRGEFSHSILEQLRNGFFLRIFSEVYRDKEIPTEISDIELMKKYMSQSLNKTSIGHQIGLRILAQIGKTLIKNKFSFIQSWNKEGVDIDTILEDLDLPIDQEIPQGLFDRNIIIKSNSDDSSTPNISFYYSKIRDYIICYHSFKLDRIRDKEFYNLLELFFINYIGSSALDFYLKNATTSQLKTYKKFKKDKCSNYAFQYNQFLEENFPKIKKEFDPKTEGKIGIVIPFDPVQNDGYSLFSLDPNSSELVHFDSSGFDLSTPSHENNIFKMGGKVYYSSNSSLMVNEQTEVLKKNLFKQLKKILEKGRLYEYDSEIILIEKVISILYFYYKKLNYNLTIDDYRLPRFDQIYPLNLMKLRDKLYKFRAEHYYKREKINRSLISQLVEVAFKTKKKIPRLNVSGDFPPFEELYKIVKILIKNGTNIIDHHYLPTPDISLSKIKKQYYHKRGFKLSEEMMSQFSRKQVKSYITQFFEKVEITYKEIVDSCFPTFANRLEFYNNIPHQYILYSDESRNFNFGHYGYKKSPNGKYDLMFKPFKENKSCFKNDGIKIMRAYSFEQFLYVNYPMQTVQRINTRKVDEYCVIRNWVYKILRSGFDEIVKEYDVRIFRPVH